MFYEEHIHEDDEIRFIIDGEGMFELLVIYLKSRLL